MYIMRPVAVKNDPWSHIVRQFSQRRPSSRLSGVRRRGLGDTCWIAPTGQRVCGAGDPAAQVSQQVCITPSTPQNTPRTAQPGGDGKPGTITTAGSNSFVWTPGSGNKRTFQFKYHAGTSDVYQLAAGGKCSGVNCSFAVVDPTGFVAWVASAPGQQEPPCTTTDPLQQTTATPGSSSQCYVNPGNGQLVCGSSTQVYPAATSTYPTYPASDGSGGAYVSTAPAAAGAPASGGLMQDLSNLPTWVKVGGGAAAAFLVLKLTKKR